MRFYKYGWLIGFVGIVVPLGINLAFKYLWAGHVLRMIYQFLPLVYPSRI